MPRAWDRGRGLPRRETMSEVELGELVIDEKEDVTTSGDGFCHIDDGSDLRTYCGRPEAEGITCAPYNGEAICPSCGLPTCPTCAVMASLNDRLEDE